MQILFQFLWSIMGLFQCWTVVDQFEQGVVLRLGKFKRTIMPGFHWLLPLGIDRALTHEVILTARETSEQSLTTQDGYKIVISTIISYILVDIKKILLEIEEAETVLENYAYGIISELVRTHDLDYIEHGLFLFEYRELFSVAALELGMEIKKVAIVNMSEIKTLRLLIPSQEVTLE